MASYGDLAGHERRGGAQWPARSAVLGLLGAALGLDRTDHEGQTALAQGYAIALMVDKAGDILRDYHTVQTVPAARAKGAATRADALERVGRNPNTAITIREYRTDVRVDVCVAARSDARWPLEQLRQALERPRFVLYFGRKSCPLARPLAPRILTADDARAALLSRQRGVESGHPRSAAIVCDPDALTTIPRNARIERRRDQPTDRVRWHFAQRDVVVLGGDAQT